MRHFYTILAMVCGLVVSMNLPVLAEDAPTPTPAPTPVPAATSAPAAAPAANAAATLPLDRLRQINEKRRAGQQLTDEEQKLVDEARNATPRARGSNRFGGAQANEVRAIMQDLNVLDCASLWTAYAQSQAGKRDEAMAGLEKVITKSPDTDAVGLARWYKGKLQQETEDVTEAVKSFSGVTGRAAPLALASLEELKAGDMDALGKAYHQLFLAQTTELDRCRVLKALVELMEQPSMATVPFEKRAEVLASAGDGITYDQAMAARAALSTEKTDTTTQLLTRFAAGFTNGAFAGRFGGGNAGDPNAANNNANGNANGRGRGGFGFGRGNRGGGQQATPPATPQPQGDF